MTKYEYKEYFEQNNFKGNNYKTAKFIQFLMGRKTKGKEIEELTGIKHSQITSYKKIINSGKMEELKNRSISKVLKSIESSPREYEKIIYGIENSKLDDIIGDFSDEAESENEGDEDLSWEDNLKRLVNRYSNEYTDELELWIGDLENQVRELKNEIKKLKIKRTPREDDCVSPRQNEVRMKSSGQSPLSFANEQQKRIIEEQKKTIEELRSENTFLLAYKKFFEEMKLRQRELEARVSEFP